MAAPGLCCLCWQQPLNARQPSGSRRCSAAARMDGRATFHMRLLGGGRTSMLADGCALRLCAYCGARPDPVAPPPIGLPPRAIPTGANDGLARGATGNRPCMRHWQHVEGQWSRSFWRLWRWGDGGGEGDMGGGQKLSEGGRKGCMGDRGGRAADAHRMCRGTRAGPLVWPTLKHR